jgi:hypothetical protein
MCELVRSSHTLGSPEIPVAFILKSLFYQKICEHPCDWSHTKSPSAHSRALGTTPDARFGSTNCMTTAGAALQCRSPRKFAERSQSQVVAVVRARNRLEPAENEPICDAVTHRNRVESLARPTACVATASSQMYLNQAENPTTEAKPDDKVVIIQNEDPVAVATNSGLDSPLDKRGKQPLPRRGRNKSAQGNALRKSAEPRVAPARTCRRRYLRRPGHLGPMPDDAFQARPAEACAACRRCPESAKNKPAQGDALRKRATPCGRVLLSPACNPGAVP